MGQGVEIWTKLRATAHCGAQMDVSEPPHPGGVREAFSDYAEGYGVPRLIETLRRKRALPPRSLLAEIVEDFARVQ